MKRILLILILLLAFILRFYQLGSIPTSLDWDEASLGYNAYSILKTGRDEYGNKFPLEFRSFGDYKPPLYVYLTIPSVYLFGLNEFAVRFPSALFGFLTVILVYLLIKELFPALSELNNLLTIFLLTISPWHLQFSRIAFEANLGLFWFVLGTLLFIKIPKNKYNLFFSAFAFILGIYTYHSLRLVVPVYVIGLSLIYRKYLFNQKKILLSGIVFSLILLLPLILLINKGVGVRFSSVTNIKPEESLSKSISEIEFDTQRGDVIGKLFHNRRIIYFLGIVKGYFDHWDFSFLFLRGDGAERHHAPDIGMLYLIEIPFVFLGIYLLIFSPKYQTGKKVILLWFFIAPFASSLTTGTPHAVRALLYIPTYQIFICIGIIYFIKLKINSNYFFRQALKLIIIFLYLFNMVYYFDMYYFHGPIEQAISWQYGYREIVKEISKIETKYNKIIVTYKYDQPYIYFLFYKKINPSWYQQNWGSEPLLRAQRAFGKYEFRNIDWEKDQLLDNALLVGTPAELPGSFSVHEIRFPQGSVAFKFVETARL